MSNKFVAPGILATSPEIHASGEDKPEPANSQLGIRRSLLSTLYMTQHTVSCFMLLRHLMVCAFALARASAGSNMAASIAMMAITTSSSIRVNPGSCPRRAETEFGGTEPDGITL